MTIDSAELLRLLLEAEGFTVMIAASGEDALLMAAEETFSLITLDLLLPGIDGWEFLERVRAIDTMARVPVVVIGDYVDRNLALAGGAADVLQKPIGQIQLHAALASLGLEPSDEHTRTVLVVDDDPKAVEVIATFLPDPEYVVVRAYGGKEAISLAQRLRPDLILLDLMMPEMSGFDVIEALQHAVETATIPILVVTAKQITAADRAELNTTTGRVIEVIQKADINRVAFVADVRRALVSQ